MADTLPMPESTENLFSFERYLAFFVPGMRFTVQEQGGPETEITIQYVTSQQVAYATGQGTNVKTDFVSLAALRKFSVSRLNGEQQDKLSKAMKLWETPECIRLLRIVASAPSEAASAKPVPSPETVREVRQAVMRLFGQHGSVFELDGVTFALADSSEPGGQLRLTGNDAGHAWELGFHLKSGTLEETDVPSYLTLDRVLVALRRLLATTMPQDMGTMHDIALEEPSQERSR